MITKFWAVSNGDTDHRTDKICIYGRAMLVGRVGCENEMGVTASALDPNLFVTDKILYAVGSKKERFSDLVFGTHVSRVCHCSSMFMSEETVIGIYSDHLGLQILFLIRQTIYIYNYFYSAAAAAYSAVRRLVDFGVGSRIISLFAGAKNRDGNQFETG